MLNDLIKKSLDKLGDMEDGSMGKAKVTVVESSDDPMGDAFMMLAKALGATKIDKAKGVKAMQLIHDLCASSYEDEPEDLLHDKLDEE